MLKRSKNEKMSDPDKRPTKCPNECKFTFCIFYIVLIYLKPIGNEQLRFEKAHTNSHV